MRRGELTVAIEIPPGFGRDLTRGRKVEIAAWIDGAMPSRAETVKGYVNGVYDPLDCRAVQSASELCGS
jgi:hypothetical protein